MFLIYKVISSILVDTVDNVNGQWGDWGTWSTCTKSCGGGQKERTRRCNNPAPYGNGRYCAGKNKETRDCNVESCPIHSTLIQKIRARNITLNEIF